MHFVARAAIADGGGGIENVAKRSEVVVKLVAEQSFCTIAVSNTGFTR